MTSMTSIAVSALAVFWILKVVRTWVDAPSWAWVLATLPLAVVATLPWQSHHLGWTSPLAIAGAVTFVQHLENLLIAKADESITAIMRRR